MDSKSLQDITELGSFRGHCDLCSCKAEMAIVCKAGFVVYLCLFHWVTQAIGYHGVKLSEDTQ
jgi:hypothetical protein